MIEHVRKAAEVLAAGQGGIIERLEAAAIELSIVELEMDKLPSSLRAEAKCINTLLSSVSSKQGEGRIRATLLGMSEAEASSIAYRILAFYVNLAADEARGRCQF